jgi:hypothetical protein
MTHTCDLDIVIHLSVSSLDTKRTQNSGNCSMHPQKCAIWLADGSAYLLLSRTTWRTRSTLHSAGCNCLHERADKQSLLNLRLAVCPTLVMTQ